MDNSNYKKGLEELSVNQLKDLISSIELVIKNKKITAYNERREIASNQLAIGDVVFVTGDKFKGEIFEVLKLNPKKVKCKRENGEVWNIPYAHIILG